MGRPWDIMKVPNLQLTGIENSSNKITGENFPTLKKEMLILVQNTNGQVQKRNSPDII